MFEFNLTQMTLDDDCCTKIQVSISIKLKNPIFFEEDRVFFRPYTLTRTSRLERSENPVLSGN